MLLSTKLGSAGVGLFVFGVAFGWVIFPKVLYSQIHKQVALKDGSPTRALWSKFPFFLEFRIWLFNVTNADEIKNGAKPILREVGPYFFEEWQEKTDLVDREEDDTVEYNIKNKWIFRPDLSEPLTGQEVLILPHTFIFAMVYGAEKVNPAMMPIVNKAINSIFKSPENVFMPIKAMDIMFDGLPIDCTVTDTAGSAVCGMVKQNADGLQQDGENMYRFSLFGARNDTPSKGRLRVKRGVKNLQDVGIVVESAGLKNISKWNNTDCDTFRGTDGTIFHPFFYENEDVVSFSPDICRSLGTQFMEKTKVSGLHTNRYSVIFDESSADPSKKCYCPAPDACLKKGVMDLFKCVGAPLIASLPHFYGADEEYLNSVEGLSPSKENHQIFLDFEPFTGSPLSARKRLQFNIMIHKVPKVKLMKEFPDAMLPLFWVEEGVVMPDYLIAQVKGGHRVVKIVRYMKWLMVLGGLCMAGVAGFLYYQTYQKSSKLQITKMPNGKRAPSLEVQTLQVPPSVE